MRRISGLVCVGAMTCALVGAAAAEAGPPPPRNVAPPLIQGVPLTGQTLTATNGVWTMGGTPYVFTYSWLRCDLTGGACTGTGVTTQTYTVRAADVGHTLRVAVTNTGDGGNGSSVTATSPPTAPVGG